MHSIWFTSDTHFGHAKILEYEAEARPFASVEEMNEALIDRWNSVVHAGDTVYHLGDFCFGRANIEIAGRLNGKKRLVMGNHDTYPVVDYLQHFDKVFGAFYWRKCVLTHIPVHPDNLGARAWLNIHGHLHSRTVKSNDHIHNVDVHGLISEAIYFPDREDDNNYFNVSVEQNNLYPFHADQILDAVRKVTDE